MAEVSSSTQHDLSIAEVIERVNAYKKSSYPWARGQPSIQPYYKYSDGEWRSVESTSSDRHSTSDHGSFAVLSDNVDFMRALQNERMIAALKHIHSQVKSAKYPCFVMLNEMTVSDLQLIQSQDWVRNSFYLTDVSAQYWESGYYGTCVLIPKDLKVTKVFRVHYEKTNMERDGLFIDVSVRGKAFRVCSTHLESLVADPPLRPSQLAMAAEFMHQADASVLGGDLNAIQPFDKTLHSENSLRDAYLETGGEEGAESGMTWGQMASTSQRNMFGLSRMDKLLFCGAVEVERFETFGLDVEVDDPKDRETLMRVSGMEKGWVTDHLGVKADFKILS